MPDNMQEKQSVAVGAAFRAAMSAGTAGAHARQLSLSLDRWPVPMDGGRYEATQAYRQVFDQRCAKGRVCIELQVLEIIPELYIQACALQLGDLRDGTVLRLTRVNRYDTPEAALRVAARKAVAILKAKRKASGLYPECQGTLLRATNWLEDILQQCDYLLDRQVNLFG